MKRLMFPGTLSMTVLALVGLALPGRADPPKDMVPFKATVQSAAPTPVGVIPGNTPLAVYVFTMTGQADPLGQVTFVHLHPVRLGVDGNPIAVDNGVGAITTANGDALYLDYHGTAHLTATGVECDHAFVITGGAGRFAGAVGSGYIHGEGNTAKNTATFTFDGIISRPKQ